MAVKNTTGVRRRRHGAGACARLVLAAEPIKNCPNLSARSALQPSATGEDLPEWATRAGGAPGAWALGALQKGLGGRGVLFIWRWYA